MITRVMAITPPEGSKPCKVKLDGKEYATFDESVYQNLTVGMEIDATVSARTNSKNGRNYTNLYLDSWVPVSAPEPPGASNGHPSVPPEVWEAKDRRIAMESAYSTAARYYAHRPGEPSDLARLARALYRDIQLAGQGQPFPPLKAPTNPPPTEE